jgi:hypothetical protein
MQKEIAVSQHNADRILSSLPLRVFDAIETPDARRHGHDHEGEASGRNGLFQSGAESSDEKPFYPLDSGEGSPRGLFAKAFEFRLSDLLRLRTFLYLLPVTGILLFQTYNTIAIKKLALANEILREQIAMSSSVIVSQELKVNELQGIHNIALQAERLGLQASSVPAVEIVP